MAETATGTTRVWGTLEQWSGNVFFAAGILVLIGTVVVGLQLLTGNEELLKDPFELAPFLGFVVSYFGLLGLYPQLADRMPRLARISVLLLLVPVVVMLLFVFSITVGFDIPSIAPISLVAFLTFALGIALFGIGSYQAEVPSRGVGLALLALATAWFVMLGAGLLNGFPISQAVNFVTLAIMTGALLAIGYRLRTETELTDHTERAPTEVRHD